MNSVLRLSASSLMRKNTCCLAVLTRSAATTADSLPSSFMRPGETFMAKNARLSRPMSPHLTIYKPQLTSMLSISHRISGVALSVGLSTFGIGMMCLPAAYPYYLSQLADLHYGFGVIYAAKFVIAFPFCYHTANGVRHLFWDAGKGFTLRALYKSGYGVVAVSLLTAAALAYL